jgi:hypothetical protein
MHARHASGRIYKLVFHANGRLCGGWNPEQHVLLETAGCRAHAQPHGAAAAESVS